MSKCSKHHFANIRNNLPSTSPFFHSLVSLFFNRLKLIIDESGNVLKHFFDTFSTEQTMIIEICYELKDTLQFASNSEIIRNMNLFNPIYESNQVMTQPAYKAVSFIAFPLLYPSFISSFFLSS